MRNHSGRALIVFGSILGKSVLSLAPIVVVIVFFQTVILGYPVSHFWDIFFGLTLVVLGLALFIQGLELGLFPVGEFLAHALARKGNVFLLCVFSFFLGFGATVAEPALIAVTGEAAKTAAVSGYIENAPSVLQGYAAGLRYTVAVAVGVAVVTGVWRIILGIPPHLFVIAGYMIVMVLTFYAPPEVIGIAYDCGVVAMSAITVPLLAALGIGLASSLRGRSPLVDGFGLVAFACVMPTIFVMLYVMVVKPVRGVLL